MADHLEIEQKFDVDVDFKRPDFAGLGDGPRDAGGDAAGEITAAAPVLYLLSATYFDTADGRLAASKITLRRRTGGTDEGWHLKLPKVPAGTPLPDGVSSRLEVHAPLAAGTGVGGTAAGGTGAGDTAAGGTGAVVPAALAARVAEVTGGLPLKPIANLDTERTVVTLTGHDGRLLAEIADDVVTARRLPDAPSAEPLRWREIEVEVPVPAPWLQRAAADLLLAAGARPPGHGSKLARLLNS